jgi:hypothetical protein
MKLLIIIGMVISLFLMINQVSASQSTVTNPIFYGAVMSMDMEQFNAMSVNRTGSLNEIWTTLFIDYATIRDINRTAIYKAKAEKVLDTYEIAICGQKATGGLLMEQRNDDLQKFDMFAKYGFKVPISLT